MDLSDLLADRMAPTGGETHLEALEEAVEDGTGLWDLVPSRSTGVEQSTETDRFGETSYTLCNPRNNEYLTLNEVAHGVWQLIDGKRSVNGIFSELYDRHGMLSIGSIWVTLMSLSNGGFLTGNIIPLDRILEDRLRVKTRRERCREFLQNLVRMKYEAKWVEGLGDRVSRLRDRPAVGTVFMLSLVVLAILGLVLFVYRFHLAKENLLIFDEQRGSSLVFQVELIIIYAIVFASVVLHELAHMLVVKYYGRRVFDAGFMLYFGVPVFYVNITDIRMAGRGARLKATLAGPLVNGAAGGILLLSAPLAGRGPAWQVLLSAGMLNMFIFIFNVLPIAEFDGNYAFEDLFNIPDLRTKSLGFLRRGLAAKIKARSSWSGEDRIYLFYGLLNLLGTLYLVYFAFELWFSAARWLFRDVFSSPGFLLPILGLILIVLAARLAQLLLRRRSARRRRIDSVLAAAATGTP